MAVDTMFATDFETLVTDVRMTTKNPSSQSAIERALEESQTRIIRILGITRVEEIRAIAPTVDKFTEDYQLKKAASLLETLHTEYVLLMDLPVSVSGQGQSISPSQQYEEEILIREAEQENLDRRKEELRCRIDELMTQVAATSNAPCFRTHITPKATGTDKMYPGETVFGRPISVEEASELGW